MVANPQNEADVERGRRSGKLEAMKSILVALDGSPSSMAALDEAVKWAARLNGMLRGIFVEDKWRSVHYPMRTSIEGGISTPFPLPPDELAVANEKVKEEGEAIRTAFLAATAGRVANASLTTPRGNVNEILIAEARAADLVVMGKRGRNDPPDSQKPGPTTEALIQDALRPVLVVPERGRTEGGVLLAYDGSISVQRAIVPGTLLAKAAGHAINVLTVDDDQAKGRATQAMLKKYLNAHRVRAVFEVARGKPAKEIIRAARSFQSGLIVMGAFGNGTFRKLLFGSSTLRVLEATPCPVLLMA